MIRHKGLQSLSSIIVFNQCSMFENWGSPQESHRPLIQTPPYVLVMISHAYVSGESSLLLFFRFSLIQNDGAESDCAFLQFTCRFYSCSLVSCAFFQLFGCLVVNFFVRCTTIWLQVEELATLWISLGRGLGDIDVAHLFHPIDICIQSDLPINFPMELFLTKCQM